MPNVAIPPIAAGTSNGDDVEDRFYSPTVTGTTSAEIINGHLDVANLAGSVSIDRSQIQRCPVEERQAER